MLVGMNEIGVLVVVGGVLPLLFLWLWLLTPSASLDDG
jgi:hypothetical protein